MSSHRMANRRPLRAPLLVLLCLSGILTLVSADLADDIKGLNVFKAAVDKNNNLEWNNNTNACQWKGVSCNGTSSTVNRVTSLRLPGMSLYGEIPTGSIGLMTELRVISLRSNKLSGNLPEDLVNCRFIRSLYLRDNDFSGPLPSNFTVWPNLVHVDLSNNNFSGQMPESLANLTQLKSLLLQNNSLSGPIPAINISSLISFNVANNNLSGEIPEAYKGLDKTEFLGNNLCGGPLPPCPESPSPAAGPEGAMSSSDNGRKKLSGGAIAGIVVGSVAGLLLVLLLFCLLGRRKEPKSTMHSNPYAARSEDSAVVAERGVGPKPDVVATGSGAGAASEDRNKLVFFEGTKHAFDLEDLLRASAEVLGKGSVGTAYKAVLETGSIVAVKRLKDVTIERRDFENQIGSVGKLKHEHLVPLIAYYYSKEEKLLVNEYMTNGSLSALLHGNKGINRTPLDWDTRVKIALGAALGIDYLHKQGFTHGNIKSSNILLTNNYNSCVSDYGLAQLVSTTPAANRIVGYRAPEVTDIRRVTHKADVYSFGVLLLELLTGKPPSQASMSEEGIDLPRWVQSVVKEEWTAEVFDMELMRFQDIEEDMVQLLQVAMQCVSPSPDQRPTMSQLVSMLENLRKHDDGDIS